MTNFHTTHVAAVTNIINKVGKNIVIGTPIGIAKPIGFLNAMYEAACRDPSIKLTIVTGLSLSRPTFKTSLERKFAEPILERLLGDYEDPIYEKDRVNQTVPSNIRIIEFFLSPAKYLHNSYVQQNYISTSYTDILRDCFAYGMNVVTQMVCLDEQSNRYSLSCSADLFKDAAHQLQEKNKAANSPYAVVVEVNQNLPVLYGNALLETENLTDVITPDKQRHLFALGREALTSQDHMIGLYASTLIKDNGCLQMGIGKLSHAITNALIIRQNHNQAYNDVLNKLHITKHFANLIEKDGGTSTFHKGLYASTEMLCDGYIDLVKQNIIKKRVYEHIGLQTLLNNGELTETINSDTLQILAKHDLIQNQLTVKDFNFLSHFGILKSSVTWADGKLQVGNSTILPILNDPLQYDLIVKHCLGDHLEHGKIIHAGFFVGSNRFYQALRDLPFEKCERIDMASIARTNSILTNPTLLSLQRKDARFMNSCMMVTLGGEVVSDCLKDFQEVSGVGGQFDFVYMASKLAGARSIIMCRSTRMHKGELISNIVWDYSTLTIPRYLRDIVITEYGIADCRSKTDSEVIKALLNITDSRFQDNLLAHAKSVGKVEKDYVIPDEFKENLPNKIKAGLKQFPKEFFSTYPFGSDMTPEELILQKALTQLSSKKFSRVALTMFKACLNRKQMNEVEKYLVRMELLDVKTWGDWIYRKLLSYELQLLTE